MEATPHLDLPPDVVALREAEIRRVEMAERFYAYDEVRRLPASDRDTLFAILERAQQGDSSLIQDIFSFVYDEIPVSMEEFVCGRRFLGLRNNIDPIKLELLIKIADPHLRKAWLAIGSGGGKALALDTPLPTPTGWTTMGAVQVGDELLDERGYPCCVVAKSEVQQRPCFRVTFDDRTSIVAADDHQWQVLDQKAGKKVRRQRAVADWREHWPLSRTCTTRQLAEAVYTPSGHRNWWVPCTQPLTGTATRLPISPYALGVWLGDGVTVHAAWTVGHADEHEMLALLAAEGVPVSHRPSGRRAGSACYGLTRGRGDGTFTRGLRELGVLGQKHVPAGVLRADAATRLAVLQGLMDTDGFVIGKRAEVGIDLTCPELADGVAELARTFGWKVRRRTKRAMLRGEDCGAVYRTRFRPDRLVFRLARKAAAWATAVGQVSRHTARWVVGVDPVETVPTQCVQVDSPSHLYLAGEGFIPTHNSFMVSVMQAWTVYNLLCLKRPDLFYMLGPGSKIASVNLSVAKDQAKDVVFAEFIGRISHAPWFTGKFEPQVGRCLFPKDVFAISGGSSATSFYGYHTIQGAIDEASYLLDREGRSLAEELVEALLKSLTTRFPNSYKLMVISTLRSDDDFLYQNIQRIKDDGVEFSLT